MYEGRQTTQKMESKLSGADLRRKINLERTSKKHADHGEYVLERKDFIENVYKEREEEEIKKDIDRTKGYLEKIKNRETFNREKVEYAKMKKQKHLDKFKEKEREIKRDVVKRRIRLENKNKEINEKLRA